MSISLKESIKQTRRHHNSPLTPIYIAELEIERIELMRRGRVVVFPRLVGAMR